MKIKTQKQITGIVQKELEYITHSEMSYEEKEVCYELLSRLVDRGVFTRDE